MADNSAISNVTLGQAIPRLIAQGQGNFSVPLSGTTVLAKFNSGNLSCIAQNSLVTFDGRSMRLGAGNSEVTDDGTVDDSAVRQAAFVSVSIITVLPGQDTTLTFNAAETGIATGSNGAVVGGFTTLSGGSFSVTTIFATTATIRFPAPSQVTVTSNTGTTTVTTTTTLPPPTATFTVTEEVLDFARVAVLFILQEATVQEATTAQTALQRFFSNASAGSRRLGSGVAVQQAMNVTLGGGNSVDFLRFFVDVGRGPTGGKRAKAKRGEAEAGYEATLVAGLEKRDNVPVAPGSRDLKFRPPRLRRGVGTVGWEVDNEVIWNETSKANEMNHRVGERRFMYIRELEREQTNDPMEMETRRQACHRHPIQTSTGTGKKGWWEPCVDRGRPSCTKQQTQKARRFSLCQKRQTVVDRASIWEM
jgi:hypothetical protein